MIRGKGGVVMTSKEEMGTELVESVVVMMMVIAT